MKPIAHGRVAQPRGMDKVWRIGVVPASLKNRRRPVIAGGRVFFVMSKKAASDQQLIDDLLLDCIPTDQDVTLTLRWFVEEDAIEFEIVPREAQPPKAGKGRKGRQDLQGIVEALCDAIRVGLSTTIDRSRRFEL